MSRLDLIDDWIEKARESRYDPRKLAKLCGVTDRHLRRYFIQNTGGPTRDWLNEVRIWIAIRELLCAKQTIAEVSNDCEFTSPRRFCEHFRRFFRSSPTRFRTDPSVIRKLLSRLANRSPEAHGGPKFALSQLRTSVVEDFEQRVDLRLADLRRNCHRRNESGGGLAV